MNELATYVVEISVSIQDIHIRAQHFISLVSSFGPFWVRMRMPDMLGGIDYSTQRIAQSIKVLDNHSHFFKACVRSISDSGNDGSGFDDSDVGERDKVGGLAKVGDTKETCP